MSLFISERLIGLAEILVLAYMPSVAAGFATNHPVDGGAPAVGFLFLGLSILNLLSCIGYIVWPIRTAQLGTLFRTWKWKEQQVSGKERFWLIILTAGLAVVFYYVYLRCLAPT